MFFVGKNSLCSWFDHKNLKITLGSKPTIKPASTYLFIVSHRVKIRSIDEKSEPVLAEFTIRPPENPIKPFPIIDGPQSIGLCNNLILSAENSRGLVFCSRNQKL